MTAVIFDLGNVVNFWRPFLALNHLFADETEMEATFQKIGFYDWNLEQDRGRSWQDGLTVAERDDPDHVHIFQAYADGLDVAHSTLVPGTSELIQRLHEKDVPLFGLTNAARASFDAVRMSAPVLTLMRDIVVSADEKMVKPDSAIFRLCLDRNGLAAGNALFIDDSAKNCAGATAVGLDAHQFVDAATLETDLIARGLL